MSNGTKFLLSELGKVVLILGGARSGKSRFAEELIEGVGGGIYLATAEASDDEMRERIAAHRARRNVRWQTIEEPIDLPDRLYKLSEAGNTQPVLIDCLTIWLANLMHESREIDRELELLFNTIEASPFSTILVSNEVGMGIVPDNPLAREFRDHAGRTNQLVARQADAVIVVVASMPQRIK